MASLIPGMKAAQLGFVVNAALAGTKLIAGLLGNSYALVADAIESATDLVSSLVVWGGLRLAARDADEEFHFGYAKAEPIAAAVVALLLVGAGIGVAIFAVQQIRTPHESPAPFTLAVLVGVIVVKEVLFRRVSKVGEELGSTAVEADAWHHRSDAITSGAAFVGICVALIGGEGWHAADDWAALVAAAFILMNGGRILHRAVLDLMDRAPAAAILEEVKRAAYRDGDVRLVETLRVRKAGTVYFVDIHVQADPAMTLQQAHDLSHRVKSAILSEIPSVGGVLVHMEPWLPS
ncbi:MAG TPA: cation diffusion facilitator family transporter [Gemmatimonadales bacterium]|nr:cation diffusion facilitator family transporter [Gemmatimonadales bacterium]